MHLWEVGIHSLTELTNVDKSRAIATHELLQLLCKLVHLNLGRFRDLSKSLSSLFFVYHRPLMLVPWILIVAVTG